MDRDQILATQSRKRQLKNMAFIPFRIWLGGRDHGQKWR
jgi:hypothetical protein